MTDDDGTVSDLGSELPPPRTLTAAEVADLGEELAAYHAHFAPFFTRSEQRVWAQVYLRGLLVADVPRKNTEAMALRLLGAGPGAETRVRALQQFVGEGGWNDDALLAAHQRLVEETLGEEDGILLIDGSDLPKQGNHSAGVARQWCGATGKRDNCQAGVYLGYASRKGYTLLDRRLYLPACWFTPEYQERWDACRIPASTPFQTKPALAVGMVEQLQAERRVRARWLACDEGYGQDPAFLDRVDASGLWYLAEVPRSTFVWPLLDPADGTTPRTRPTTWVPPATPGRGRPPSRVRLQPDSPAPLAVEALAALPAAQWHRYRLLEGSKGPLVAEFTAVRAVAVRDGLPGPDVWVLLRRPLPVADETPEVKYYLSQAPADTPLATLVRVSGMRWPIEACFEEGKEEVGLDHYELRFWRGWYHHMTLVILAHHFLVRLQRRLAQRGGGPAASDPSTLATPSLATPGAGAACAGGLPGRRGPSGISAPAPAGPLGAAFAAPGAPTLAGAVTAALLRPHRRPGARRLSAAPQPRRLPLPPQTHPPAPDRARAVTHVPLYY